MTKVMAWGAAAARAQKGVRFKQVAGAYRLLQKSCGTTSELNRVNEDCLVYQEL